MKNIAKLFQRVMTLLMLAYVLPGYANDLTMRYRGAYTYGHEVNTFCPSINSQCYWLNPATSEQIRQQLKHLSATHTSRPYQSVCVVLSGQIDRETKSDGFAADYDGLIEVDKVFGLCGEVDIVTQGDLQHHRWTLESVNGVTIALAKHSNPSYSGSSEPITRPPKSAENSLSLEFGEQMTVFADTGCNKLSGRAVLREDFIIITMNNSAVRTCSAEDEAVDTLLKSVFSSEPIITIDSDKSLLLKGANSTLKYQLKDWVY